MKKKFNKKEYMRKYMKTYMKAYYKKNAKRIQAQRVERLKIRYGLIHS